MESERCFLFVGLLPFVIVLLGKCITLIYTYCNDIVFPGCIYEIYVDLFDVGLYMSTISMTDISEAPLYFLCFQYRWTYTVKPRSH